MRETAFARHLRQKQTPEEVIIWGMLRGRRFDGLKFRRQVPVGDYFADFLCESEKLIIEIDGSDHDEKSACDDQRTHALNSHGYHVVRLSNHDVRTDLDLVRAEIRTAFGHQGVTS